MSRSSVTFTVGPAHGQADLREVERRVQEQIAAECRREPSSDICVGRAALQIADRCKAQLPKRSGDDYDPAHYLGLAECEENAAKAPAKLAEELKAFAQDNRRHAKPGATIGMTAEQVINETSWGKPARRNTTLTAEQVINETSWGKPARRNTTLTAAGTREQWVYYNSYLYFENGRLVSVQVQH